MFDYDVVTSLKEEIGFSMTNYKRGKLYYLWLLFCKGMGTMIDSLIDWLIDWFIHWLIDSLID